MKNILFSLCLCLILVAGFGNLAKGQCCTNNSQCAQWCIENDLCDTISIWIGLGCSGCSGYLVTLPVGGVWCNGCYIGGQCGGSCSGDGQIFFTWHMASTGGPDVYFPGHCFYCYGVPDCGWFAHWDPLTNTWHLKP